MPSPPPSRTRAEWLLKEGNLPDNVDAANSKLDDPEERARMARVFERGLTSPPATCCRCSAGRPGPTAGAGAREKWKTRRGHLFLVPGDQPGRLPPAARLAAACAAGAYPHVIPLDPTHAARRPARPRPARLPRQRAAAHGRARRPARTGDRIAEQRRDPAPGPRRAGAQCHRRRRAHRPRHRAARRAACASSCRRSRRSRTISTWSPRPRRRRAGSASRSISKATRRRAIRASTSSASRPIPASSRSTSIPAASWRDAVAITTAVYEEARQSRLGADKFMIDGRHTGTGGGNHVVVGGDTPDDSPFLRRPDLLQEPGPLLAAPPVAVLPVLRPVHRPDQPGAAHRRGAPRFPLRTGDRAGAGAAAGAGGRRRRPGWSTGCSATCWSTSPATPTAPRSASTSSIRPTAPPAGSGWSSSAASRCRPARA